MKAKTKPKPRKADPAPANGRDESGRFRRGQAPPPARKPRLVVELAGLHTLHGDAENPNKHPEEDVRDLMAKLATFSQVEPLVVQRSTRKVIGGNGRLEAMYRLGWTQCEVTYVDCDDVTATALGIALNRRRSSFDDSILVAQLQAIRAANEDLMPAVGYVDAEIDALIAGLKGDATPAEDPGPQIDRAEELLRKWKVKAGQLWIIPSKATPGKEHRVLCGDCREPKDIARHCPEKVNGAFTSPPYAEQRKEQYGGVPADEYVDWWEVVQANVRGALADDGSFFVNIKAHCEDGERSLYVMDLVTAMKRRWGWKFIDEFAWLRNPTPKQVVEHFKQGFEPIYHLALSKFKFRPENVRHASESVPIPGGDGVGDTGWSGRQGNEWALKNIKGLEAGMAYPSTVLDFAKGGGGIEAHAAAFPPGLPSFFLKAFSDPGDTWLDPFLGSGTTIVAAEQTGRLCRGIEIAPKYVAVALERLSGMGLEPKLSTVSSG